MSKLLRDAGSQPPGQGRGSASPPGRTERTTSRRRPHASGRVAVPARRSGGGHPGRLLGGGTATASENADYLYGKRRLREIDRRSVPRQTDRCCGGVIPKRRAAVRRPSVLRATVRYVRPLCRTLADRRRGRVTWIASASAALALARALIKRDGDSCAARAGGRSAEVLEFATNDPVRRSGTPAPSGTTADAHA